MNGYIILSKNRVYCDIVDDFIFNKFVSYLNENYKSVKRKSVSFINYKYETVFVEQFWLNSTMIKHILWKIENE